VMSRFADDTASADAVPLIRLGCGMRDPSTRYKGVKLKKARHGF
jgi:hypothetical protein